MSAAAPPMEAKTAHHPLGQGFRNGLLGRQLLIYCYCTATSSQLRCYSESASGKALAGAEAMIFLG